MPGAKELIAVDEDGTRRTIASGLPLGAAPGVVPKPLKGMPPFSGPQGPFAGIAAGPDGTLYVSADADGSVLAFRRDGRRWLTPPTTATCRSPARCGRRSSTASTRSGPSCPPNTNYANAFRSVATPCGRRCAGCGTTTWSHRGRGPGLLWCRVRPRTPTSRTSSRSTTCWPSPPGRNLRSTPPA